MCGGRVIRRSESSEYTQLLYAALWRPWRFVGHASATLLARHQVWPERTPEKAMKAAVGPELTRHRHTGSCRYTRSTEPVIQIAEPLGHMAAISAPKRVERTRRPSTSDVSAGPACDVRALMP